MGLNETDCPKGQGPTPNLLLKLNRTVGRGAIWSVPATSPGWKPPVADNCGYTVVSMRPGGLRAARRGPRCGPYKMDWHVLFLPQIFPIESRVGGGVPQREGLGWSWGRSSVDVSRSGSILAH